MTHPAKPSKLLIIALWTVQVLLALTFMWAAAMKLFQPIEKLSAMWPWTAQVSAILVKLTGIVDLLGAIGILLPSLLRIQPKLTSFAATGIVALMIAAGIFHILRKETSSIGVNIAFALMAIFVIWGRYNMDKHYRKESPSNS
jgi:hypothetical protein